MNFEVTLWFTNEVHQEVTYSRLMLRTLETILLAAFLLFASIALAQIDDSLDFPEKWEGEWAGELVISSGKGELQRLPMLLKILPLNDSTHTYTIVYGEESEEENTRPYYLIERDQEIGHYIIDEDNGIMIDDFYINNKLYSRFEVMGNLLLATLEQRDEQLIYEIISGSLTPIRMTGDTIIGDEEIPPVNNYNIRVQQRAILTRQ